MTAEVNGVHHLYQIHADGDELVLGIRNANGELWQRVAEGKRRD